MGTTSIILIIVLETLALCLFLLAIVVLKNRKLRRLVAKLQSRIQKLFNQHTKNRRLPAALPAESYPDKLSTQIELTRDYHASLSSFGTRRDISLDLNSDAPLLRRTAALRHAFLVAEKEAIISRNKINWDLLATRYHQIFSFQSATENKEQSSQEELHHAKEELNPLGKQGNDLEHLKSMSVELKERWNQCKNKADERYAEIKSLAEQIGQAESFDRLLNNYRESYADLGQLIEMGLSKSIMAFEDSPEECQQEIRRVRNVAAAFTELQNKLTSADNADERAKVVVDLQTELQKQARLLSESEAGIKQGADELPPNKPEMKTFAGQREQMPKLKNKLKELESTVGIHEQVTESLRQENRRLAKQLKLAQEAPPEEKEESKMLRKELAAVQAKYNDLEEKFLNLKLRE